MLGACEERINFPVPKNDTKMVKGASDTIFSANLY